MSFIKKISLTGISSLSFAISSLFINKFTSIFLGTSGLAIMSHFQNIVAIFVMIPNDGINRGVNKFLTAGIPQNEFNRYFTAVLLINAACFAAVLLFFVAGFQTYEQAFPEHIFEPHFVALIVCGIALHYITLWGINFILTQGQILAYSIFSLCNNIGACAIAWIGFQQGIASAMVSFIIGLNFMFLPIVVYIIIYYKKIWIVTKPVFELKAIAHILEYVYIALSGLFFGRLVDLYTRGYAIQNFTLHDTGLWQAVVKISDGCGSVFSAAIGALLISKFSNASSEQIKHDLKKLLLQIWILSAGVLLTIYINKNWILTLLYSDNFLGAQNMLAIQLAGDLFKFPAWVLGFLMMARLRTRDYIFLQAFSAFCYLSLLTLMNYVCEIKSIEIFPIANTIRFILYFLATLMMNRKYF